MADLKFVIDVEDSDVVRTLKNHEKLEKEIMSLQKQYGLLKQAQSQGMISQAAYAKGISQIDGRIGHLTKTLSSGATAINKHADYMAMAKNKMSKYGMVSQQVGYQVGDFFVQIQSGQNKMVAFTQQATQLAGLIPGIGGAFVGITLSVVGFAYQMYSAEKASKDLTDALEAVKEALKGLDDAKKALSDNLEQPINSANVALTNYLKTLANVQKELLKTKMAEAFQAVKKPLAETISDTGGQLSKTGLFSGELSLLGEQREEVQKQNDLALELHNTFARIADGPVEAMAQKLLDFHETLGKSGRLTKSTNAIFDQLLSNTGLLAAEQEKAAAKDKAAKDQAAKDADIAAKTFLANQKIEQDAAAQTAKARTAYFEMIEQAHAALGFYSKSRTLDAERMAKEQADMTKAAQDAMNKYGMMRTVTAKIAADLKEAADQTFRIAQAELAANKSSGISQAGRATGRYGKGAAFKYTGPKLDENNNVIAEKANKISGKTLDIIEATAKARMAALLLGGEELALYERQLDIRQALGDYSAQYSDATVRAAAERIEAMQREEDAINRIRQRNEDLAQTIAQTMGDGLMSIVDGTKSVEQAFKDMARLIIVELYKVLVVEQMVLAIKNAIKASGYLPFENGSAFSGGNVVPFASGGVVGSPTTFGMSGGRTGLMGEAGPEAIMPLQRGPNGKLGVAVNGGESGTTVNQVINISTGVQQTVRNEIRSMMPQIAEASKAAVVDAKRRGGSYGGNFR
jgi:phage-related minor tail protein